MTDPALAVLAASFAVVTGANDGGTILAIGLKLPRLRVWVALVALAGSTAVVPLVLGTAVAATFTNRLVSFGGQRTAMVIGVLTALAVVVVLTRFGQPTSLTLATVGGLTGAGAGYGLPVSTAWVVYVLALGVAAPVVGGVVAAGVSRLLPRFLAGGALGRAHQAGFALECLAYAANDGQKMLAVLAVATASAASAAPARLPLWALAVMAVLFAAGSVYGLPRAGRTLGGQILAVRPVHAVSAEIAASATVLGCAALGVPVSMTQSVAGGLIGAGVSHGPGRVRWHAATKIAIAWLLTLPATVLVAAGGAVVVRSVF
ncbi:MAG: inorganic phosphate transporter [Carbonactinosporaceae bacterium]